MVTCRRVESRRRRECEDGVASSGAVSKAVRSGDVGEGGGDGDGGGDGGGDDDLTSSTLTTPHSVLLKWALLQDIAVIPRSRKPENIEANWQAMTTDDDGTLSDEHFELLSGVDEGIRVCWDPSTVR